MKYTLITIILYLVICSDSVHTQSNIADININVAITGLETALIKNNPLHYRAKMQFKEFGGDTFEIREVLVNFKYNTHNLLYGYDFEVTEKLKSGNILTVMALNQSIYTILHGTKRISERIMPNYIELGSYFETIRNYFIISEVFRPFMDDFTDEITLVDSNNLYYLNRRMSDFATRQLVLDKDSFLPIKSTNIITSLDFDLVQTQEIYFNFDPNKNSLPDSSFSIDYYLSSGYNTVFIESDTSFQPNELNSISSNNLDLLLNYPFIKASGDTTLIKEYTEKYIILDFWFASCLPCLRALPELNLIAESYANLGVKFLSLNCFDKGISAKLEAKMLDKNINIPLLFGSKDLIQLLEISNFPSYYLISQDRKIETIYGGIDGLKKTLNEIFD